MPFLDPANSSATSGNDDDRIMPIAIVGLGCRLPGDATSPEKLWDLLARKQSARSEVPADRFNIDAFHHPNGDRNGTVNNRGGHFLNQDLGAFDASFFSISPAEAVSMDPMQRMLLEVVYEATENAGISISSLAGSDTGCFVGCFTSDFNELAKRDPELLPKYHTIGTGQSILSNRVSFFYDLKGPSMTIDTACSSSLVAVHLACQSLRAGESKAALVGATNAILSPDMQIGMTNLHFLSPDSICYSFDERSNGYSRGEGVVALVLKPLDEAVRAGDTIRAVIRGTAVNSDGKGPGITLPSKDAQISLIRSAYEQAGCDPAQTGYFEAHGTGTPVGDPIECGAIGATLGQYRSAGEENKLFIGSIKTNIGHLEGASGLAGLTKAVLSLEKGVIAPNLWFNKGNPSIDFDGWKIRVPTEVTPWPMQGVRRASVNSFGYGGTNGHVILDDAYHYMKTRGITGRHQTHVTDSIHTDKSNDMKDDPISQKLRAIQNDNWSTLTEKTSTNHAAEPFVFHIAAHEEKTAKHLAGVYSEYLSSSENGPFRGQENEFLANLAYTLSERRSLLPWSCSVVARSTKELAQKLAKAETVTKRLVQSPKLGFVFNGQGAQWWAMGRELLDHAIFSASLAECDRCIQRFGASWSLRDELLKTERESRVNEAAISQPLCTAIQICLVDLFASWSIYPARVVGHSSGEIAAAYATGAFSVDTAMRIAYFRGLTASTIKGTSLRGSMMAAGLSKADALKEIEKLNQGTGKVGVACVNSPRSVTISGDLPMIMELQSSLSSRGIFARRLLVDTAYHSHHMLTIAEKYRQHMGDLPLTPWEKRKPVEMFSSVTGQLVSTEDLTAEYWIKNMVSTVEFSDALECMCAPPAPVKRGRKVVAPVDLIIELGPHSALAGPIKQTLTSNTNGKVPKIPYLSALVRGKKANESALEVAGLLFALGHSVNLHTAQFGSSTNSALLQQKRRPKMLTDLPSYPWNHERKYWTESRLSYNYRQRLFPRTDILGAPFHDWNPIEPRWRNFIRLSEQPWVKSHVVQGTILYPAAGYCCMALQAATQMNAINKQGPISEYRLHEVSISRALVVPQTEDGVEVVFTMRPNPMNSVRSSDTCNEFRVFSYTSSAGWTENCRGLVSVKHDDDNSFSDHDCAWFHTIQQACHMKMDTKQLYEDLDAVGLYYGPEFQGITSLEAGENKTIGCIKVTDTRSVMPKEFEFDRVLHPSTMDTFLQMGIAALGSGNIGSLKSPYVPTFIRDIHIKGGFSSDIGTEFKLAASSRFQGFREAYADVLVASTASNTEPVIRVEDIKYLAIAVGGSVASTEEDNGQGVRSVPTHAFSVTWEPDIDLIPKDKLGGLMRSSIASDDSIVNRIKDFELVGWYFTSRLLQQVGEDEYKSMLPHHQKFYRYMQHQYSMVQSGTHEQMTKEWTQLESPTVSSKIAALIKTLSEDPTDFEGRMFTRMGEALPSVLRQEIEPLTLMMEDNLLHNYYTVSLGTPRTYPQAAKYVHTLSHKYPNLRYLEIGAGTGGLTVPILEALQATELHPYPRLKSYTYTDISTGFFEKAKDKFSQWGGLIDFRKLDIEQDPATQGFSATTNSNKNGSGDDGLYDVILAANVLHATYDIDRTMANVRKLLRPGGKLVLLDMTHSLLSVSLIWGNVPGWWNCRESWRDYGPLLDEAKWNEVFLNNGFRSAEASTPDYGDPVSETTRVMVTSVADSEPQKSEGDHELVILHANPATEPVDELVAATKDAFSRLASIKSKITVCSLSEVSNTTLKGKIVISFVELEKPILSQLSAEQMTSLQHVTHDADGLLWITRGGTSTKGTLPEFSLFQGLARTLRSERGGFICLTIDLDSEPQLPAAEASSLLASLFERRFSSDAADFDDSEFSEEAGVLRIKRAFETLETNKYVAALTGTVAPGAELSHVFADPERPLELKVQTLGSFDSLVFDDHKSLLVPYEMALDEVEVDVRAVGLNYRDVLVSTGEVSDTYLGNECAGTVSRVGTNITHVKPGDRVAAWCLGCFSTKIRNPGQLVQRIPDEMSFAVAASLPHAYVTAYYSLIHVAHLEKGETILIHAAAGGVGQAAIQISQMIGAEVFVTVGTPEKRQCLIDNYGIPEERIFSSRDASFAPALNRATAGRGVDVILNSLAGELLQTSWKCVAPFGRFIEIGKRDIDVNGRLEMETFSRNVTFASVDVTVLIRKNLALAERMFGRVMDLVRGGKISQPLPLTIQPWSNIGECFRTMHAGKHIGKIVLEPRANDLVPIMPKPPTKVQFTADASYLLVGGLGGLGQSIARWMVAHGARNLIFISRSSLSQGSKSAVFIEELTSSGARAEVLKCDVTNRHLLTTALNDITTEGGMPPIRGVFQGAMVLNDQIFDNMTAEQWNNAIQPKVQGSWAIHQAMQELVGDELDFFILLSSAATFTGSAGQANYVAGCNFQGSLAAHRRTLGLAATAIDISVVQSVGFVAEKGSSVVEMNVKRTGWHPISEAELLALFELAILKPELVPNGHIVTGIHSSIAANDPEQEQPPWANDPVCSHLDFTRPYIMAARKAGKEDQQSNEVVHLPTVLGQASTTQEAITYMLQGLTQKLARLLMMPPQEIDPERSTGAYGIDSLVAVEVRNWFLRDVKADIPVFEILQSTSLNTLAADAVRSSGLVREKLREVQ